MEAEVSECVLRSRQGKDKPMDHTFIEVLIQRKRNGAAGILKIALGAVTVLSLLLFFYSFFCIVVTIAAGLGAYYFYLQEYVEYEYSFLDRELTVDKIMAKSVRRKQGDYQMDRLTAAAPEGSSKLDGYRNGRYKVKNYSGNTETPRMILYFEDGLELILDRDEELLQAMRMVAPSKVSLQ